MTFQMSLLCTLLLLPFGCSKPEKAIPSAYTRIGDIDQSNFNEPSGICFHSVRKTLFVVGDEGDLCEIETDGTLIQEKRIRSGDFEGVTHNPTTGLIYIAVEDDESILEVDPDTFKILREFTVPRQFEGDTVMDEGSNGFEGITFMPDAKHPEGGTFIVAHQSFTLDDPEEISALFELEVPLKTSKDKKVEAKILRCIKLDVIDLAALYFNVKTQQIYVVSDETNNLISLDKSGNILEQSFFPEEDQEGITFDDQGFIYIAQDSGGIIKLKKK